MPRFDKLFHVLVVLGAASCGEDDTESRDRLTDATQNPTGDGAQASDGVPAGDGAELTSCFCESDACCDRTGETPVLQEGFACCWAACS